MRPATASYTLFLHAALPIFRKGALVVRAQDDIGRIRLAGRGVELVPVAVVRPQLTVAERPGADVDRHPVGRIELAAVADDLDRRLLERVVGIRVAKLRRRTGVDGR